MPTPEKNVLDEYHVARLHLADKPAAERRRHHERERERDEEESGLRRAVPEVCLREYRDEEYRADERHEDDEVVEHREHERGYLEEIEIDDGLRSRAAR